LCFSYPAFAIVAIASAGLIAESDEDLSDSYDSNITANHLDVGVGTGYFLEREARHQGGRCQFSSSAPRIALMDLNATNSSCRRHNLSFGQSPIVLRDLK
jgi:hypothetical protein